MAKLKVFRTPIGFHDAYVAAPSRKAALAAWGSDADLFARGVAEEVSDPALTAEPLAAPGTVIRRSRGTAAEQLAALPPDPVRAKAPAQDEAAQEEAAPGRRTKSAGTRSLAKARPAPAPPPPPRAPRPPKPDGKALDAAEEALTNATRHHRAALTDLVEREKRLARERRDVEAAQAAEATKLEQTRDTARTMYDAELRRWRTWGKGSDAS